MNLKLFILAAGVSAIYASIASAQCAVPTQIDNGTIIDAVPVMSDFDAVATCSDQVGASGAQNSVQTSGTNGGFAAVGPLTDGQLLVGSAGNAANPTTLTAGAGVNIANAPGSVTISTSGVPAGGGADWLNGTAVVKPNAADFTLRTSSTAPPGAALSSTSRGMMLTTTSAPSGFSGMMAEVTLPSGHWQATMLAIYTGPLSTYGIPGIAVRDSVNNKSVQLGIGPLSATAYRFDYQKTSGGVGLDTYQGDAPLQDVGFPLPTEPIWSRLTFDGTNLIWSFSRDGEFYITAYSVTASSFLANLSTIGPIVFFASTAKTTWSTTFHVLSWQVVSL